MERRRPRRLMPAASRAAALARKRGGETPPASAGETPALHKTLDSAERVVQSSLRNWRTHALSHPADGVAGRAHRDRTRAVLSVPCPETHAAERARRDRHRDARVPERALVQHAHPRWFRA